MADNKSFGSGFREGAELLREMAANPGQVVREIVAEYFPFIQLSTPTPQQSTSIVRQPQPSAQNVPDVTCGIYRSQEPKAGGGTVRNFSYYSLNALDALSFDPFIIHAEASHDAARSQGLFGLLRLKKEAWLEEHLTDATVRKLQSQQAILEEQRKTVEAGTRLRRAMMANVTDPQGSALASASYPPALSAPTARSALPAQAPMRPNITDEEIENAALRAVMEGVMTQAAWQPYREALLMHLPPFAVAEIEDRLYELWRLNPSGAQRTTY